MKVHAGLSRQTLDGKLCSGKGMKEVAYLFVGYYTTTEFNLEGGGMGVCGGVRERVWTGVRRVEGRDGGSVKQCSVV